MHLARHRAKLCRLLQYHAEAWIEGFVGRLHDPKPLGVMHFVRKRSFDPKRHNI